MMIFDNGLGAGIRCRFICEWYKIESIASDTERFLSEIEKNQSDDVFIDIDVYGRINGIGTSERISLLLNTPVFIAGKNMLKLHCTVF